MAGNPFGFFSVEELRRMAGERSGHKFVSDDAIRRHIAHLRDVMAFGGRYTEGVDHWVAVYECELLDRKAAAAGWGNGKAEAA